MTNIAAFNAMTNDQSPVMVFEGQALRVADNNSSIILPANAFILGIQFQNLTANAVTGGVRFGTSAGGTQIVTALTVGSNGLGHVTDANLTRRFFSSTSPTTVFIEAVTAWNSAIVNFRVLYVIL